MIWSRETAIRPAYRPLSTRAQLDQPGSPGRRRACLWQSKTGAHPPQEIRHHGCVLQVTDLSVEIGGKTTLNKASFTVRAGDKVGLVGRNGAGKTTLFKTLGGERASAGGKILRKGDFGYLPQDPKADARTAETTALTHVLAGRGLDEALMRMEKLATDHGRGSVGAKHHAL